MTAPPRPIGYWLKRLDRAIEDAFERDLAAFALARRHWQVLNTVAAGPIARPVVLEALAPFWTDGAVTGEEVLAALVERGWVRETGADLVVTRAGAGAHRSVAQRVEVARARILDGLTVDDYATVLRLLEQMTRNVEAAGPAPAPTGGPRHGG